MKTIILTLLTMFSLTGCCVRPSQADSLIYCSYACEGMAGLGTDYCELIADEGTSPKVVVALDLNNRFGTPETHREFEVDSADVARLAKTLEDIKIKKLDGYRVDERMTGGREYRIRAHYASGQKVFASWYGHDIKEEALAAYSTIQAFFAPWVKKAGEETVPAE